MLVDSHCHLDFPDFKNDLERTVRNATENGVVKMLSIATTLPAVAQVQAIANKFAPVYYAAGVHPMHVHEHAPVHLDDLLALTHSPKMVAIGETGLDYYYTSEHAQIQQDMFRLHIVAARTAGIPVIVHARAADEDMARILSEEYEKGPFACVLHCFSSGAELARVACDLGFYFSMSGIVTFKKSVELRDIFKTIPIERILVETDAPYLAPSPYRGKRNEPAYVRFTAQVGAQIFGMDDTAFAHQTTHNFYRLFSRVPV